MRKRIKEQKAIRPRLREETGKKLPPGVKLLRTLKGHQSGVWSVAFDPKGETLAGASSDKTVKLWEAHSGKLLRTLKGHQSKVCSVAFDPQGETLASASSDKTVKLWEARSGKLLRTLKGHEGIVHGVAFDPQGETLASASSDKAVKIWEVRSGNLLCILKGHGSTVYGVAFDSQGKTLASASADKTVQLWDARSGERLLTLKGHKGLVYHVAFDPQGEALASASSDCTVKIWEARSGQLLRTLEGHADEIHSVAFSPDGRLLASMSRDQTIRLWRSETCETVATIPVPTLTQEWTPAITFHPRLPLLAAAGAELDASQNKQSRLIHFWTLDFDVLLSKRTAPTVTYTSAKVILVGESNVGKSYLAHRIATGALPERGTIPSTHGMKFWSLKPGMPLSTAVTPAEKARRTYADKLFGQVGGEDESQRRDIVLWDLGGQSEYRLIHQLFLPDTAVALVLFDPTRGASAFTEVEAWNKSLEKQLRGRAAVKLLVGAKVDQPSEMIDRQRLERLRQECGFAGYFETSAITGRGIEELCEGVAAAIDWKNLGTTARPELFQRIRDQIEKRSQRGEVVLAVSELVRSLSAGQGTKEEESAADAVSDQLAAQGIIARAQLSTGERVLVLQVQEIERYAGSLILAARNNPRGVPALELRLIAQENFHLPGIKEAAGPLRKAEKMLLECTVQLLIGHGICFQHEGLLIFPSLFAVAPDSTDEMLPHAVSIYYDFAGAIDNIYAALIAWLVLARSEFGAVRLWADRAEFEIKGGSLCGLRKVSRPGGFAHMDVYFGSETPKSRRKEFISFVEDHLARNGVEIREHVAITCQCGYEFAEETLRLRIARGDKDVACPVCETRHSLAEGAAVARKRDAAVAQHTWAMRTEIEKSRARLTRQVVEVLAKAEEAKPATRPIRLLHLSDLHFTEETSVVARLQWLLDDLKPGSGLGFPELDYLVISGDFTDKGRAAGFEKAYEFVSGLTQEFGLSAERCIFVPGNHDVCDLHEAYEWRDKTSGLQDGEWVKQGDIVLVRNTEKYPLRLKPFSDTFYHKFTQRPYPLDSAAQGFAIPFWETGLQFLALNSCWQIDQFHRRRSGVRVEAVANAVNQAQKQEEAARKTGQLAAGQPLLRIAVWHHAVAGPEQMRDTEFIGNLQKKGVRLALHGDVHETRRDLVGYRHKEGIHMIGSGNFGARDWDRPESSPRLYNVLEIARDLTSVKVHTRCQPRPDGPWDGWYEWPDPESGKGRRSYYDLRFDGTSKVPARLKLESELTTVTQTTPAKTDAPPSPQVPPALLAAIHSRQCVLFAGGGVSAAAGVPAWRYALPEILRHLHEAGYSLGDELKSILATAQPFQALEVLSSQIPKTSLLTVIRAVLAPTAGSSTELCDLLGKVEFCSVLTDRWDQVASDTFTQREPVTLLPQDTQLISQQFSRDTFYILKLYGDLDRPETVPLSQRDYQRLIAEHPTFAQLVASVFASTTVLFLGCRLESIEQFLLSHRLSLDPQSHKHYALVSSSPDFPLQVQRFRQSYALELIALPPTTDYAPLSDFVHDLHELAVKGKPGEATLPPESSTISHVTLSNIGPFEKLSMPLHAFFTVFLGNNSCGKSSVLRAIALALCSHSDKLERAAAKLLKQDAPSGFIELRIGTSTFRTDLTREDGGVRARPQGVTPLQMARYLALAFPPLRGVSLQETQGAAGEIEQSKPEVEDLMPILAEAGDARLDDIKQWLVNCHVRATAAEQSDKPLADELRSLITAVFSFLQDMMPSVSLKFAGIDERFRILVETDDGKVPLEYVSQGMNSIINWVGLILKRLHDIHGWSADYRAATAIVLIDELDAHMHPLWQLKLIPLLRQHFPNFQFIGATHSPLVISNIQDGAIYRFHRDEQTNRIEARRQKERPAGMGSEGILTSEMFGLRSDLDEETLRILDQQVDLVTKEHLTPAERTTLAHLTRHIEGLGFRTARSDPYYGLFLKALARRPGTRALLLEPALDKDGMEKLARETDEILAEIDTEEVANR